jgi:transcription elongation factor Elf1
VVGRDETGSLVDLNFTCPHCGSATGELILIGAGKDLDHPWETDQVCGICDEAVIVEVPDPQA